MQAVLNKIKRVATILKNDDAIIITVSENALVVDACNKQPDELKRIAANFFKTVYKIN